MQLLIPYNMLKDNYFTASCFKDINFSTLNTFNVKYVFDEFLYGETVEDISSDYYLDKVLDTRLHAERGLHQDELGFIAEELFPVMLDELKGGYDSTSLSNAVLHGVNLTPSGFLINLKLPVTKGRA